MMAVAADEPFGVVELGPGGDSLAEFVDGVMQLGPEALLFECADESFGTSVGFGFANERGVICDPEPVDRPEEVFRPVLGSPVVSQADSSSDIGFKPTEPINDGVVDGLECSDPVATLGDVGPGFGRPVIDVGEDPHPPVGAGPGRFIRWESGGRSWYVEPGFTAEKEVVQGFAHVFHEEPVDTLLLGLG